MTGPLFRPRLTVKLRTHTLLFNDLHLCLTFPCKWSPWLHTQTTAKLAQHYQLSITRDHRRQMAGCRRNDDT